MAENWELLTGHCSRPHKRFASYGSAEFCVGSIEMKKAYIVMIIAVSMVGCSSMPKRTASPQEDVQRDQERLPSRPALTMQEAISTAERHIEANNIDVSRHYLSRAHIVYTSTWMEGIHWVITWSLKVPSDGGQIFVNVGNDKSVRSVKGL